jgi:DUF1680 family protein
MMVLLPLRGVCLSEPEWPNVTIEDPFWTPILERNRTNTIPYCLHQIGELGWVENFRLASDRIKGNSVDAKAYRKNGNISNDVKVFKTIEAAGYSLAMHPDEQLRKRVAQVVQTVLSGQRPDGYVHTFFTVKSPSAAMNPLDTAYQLYILGHFIDAGIGWYHGTGDRALLNGALRYVDLVGRNYGPEKRHAVPDHQGVELALLRLWELGGRSKDMDLAAFFLEERGHHSCGRPKFGRRAQDHIPLAEQFEAVGHGVRGPYTWAAMADLVRFRGHKPFETALDKLFEDVTGRKMFLTGGVGSASALELEVFLPAYDLPNDKPDVDTCSSIGLVYWLHRMNLHHRDARYFDVLERVLYNRLLSGVSLDGLLFAYGFPQQFSGDTEMDTGGGGKWPVTSSHLRKPWYPVSCCPPNLARFFPTLPRYVYAQSHSSIYVNLFVSGESRFNMAGGALSIKQETQYPWNGQVKISLMPADNMQLSLHVRIPSWTGGSSMPGYLYPYVDLNADRVRLAVNGKAAPLGIDKGYAIVTREWRRGDVVELSLPMPPRRVFCDERATANRGLVALHRGPLIYCLEEADNGKDVLQTLLPKAASISVRSRPDLLGGVSVLEGRASSLIDPNRTLPFLAVPFYAWDNRAAGKMTVWVRNEEGTKDGGRARQKSR